MKQFIIQTAFFLGILLCLVAFCAPLNAQTKIEILDNNALTRVIPKSFYFAGQSADTQSRNTAAAKLAADRHIIAGLVDTSGYSTEISGKYEGFLITDSRINIGGRILQIGAYGFGFSSDGKLNIFDLSSAKILSVATRTDPDMKRPRPLMMTADAKTVRLYKGKIYVTITQK